jgi:hypothetical protein
MIAVKDERGDEVVLESSTAHTPTSFLYADVYEGADEVVLESSPTNRPCFFPFGLLGKHRVSIVLSDKIPTNVHWRTCWTRKAVEFASYKPVTGRQPTMRWCSNRDPPPRIGMSIQ